MWKLSNLPFFRGKRWVDFRVKVCKSIMGLVGYIARKGIHATLQPWFQMMEYFGKQVSRYTLEVICDVKYVTLPASKKVLSHLSAALPRQNNCLALAGPPDPRWLKPCTNRLLGVSADRRLNSWLLQFHRLPQKKLQVMLYELKFLWERNIKRVNMRAIKNKVEYYTFLSARRHPEDNTQNLVCETRCGMNKRQTDRLVCIFLRRDSSAHTHSVLASTLSDTFLH